MASMRAQAGFLLAGLASCGGDGTQGLVSELHGVDRTLVASLSRRDARAPQDTSNRYALDPRAAQLGKRLFFDKRLSHDGSQSCATCHDPENSWSDGRKVAQGLEKGTRNTPSLWNTAYGRWWFWDGRADSLWSQALRPIETAHEMGGTRLAVLRVIAGDQGLRAPYEAIFGSIPAIPAQPAHASPRGNEAQRAAWSKLPAAQRAAIDEGFVNVGKALAAFEHKIVANDTPFDRFARGLASGDATDRAALDASAQRGLALFVGRAGCILCHHGPDFTDYEFHNIGLISEEEAQKTPRLDLGRYAGIPIARSEPFRGVGEASNRFLTFVTQRISNMGEFKTPSLRNVSRTAPYMHDGRFASLGEVLDFYSELPGRTPLGHREESLLPLKLSADEKRDLRAFLESLTDESALRELRKKT